MKGRKRGKGKDEIVPTRDRLGTPSKQWQSDSERGEGRRQLRPGCSEWHVESGAAE